MRAAETSSSLPARRDSWKLYLLILVCVAPVIASYLAYYVFPPSERTNYGTLVEPQRPVPALAAELVHSPADPAGELPALKDLGSLKGRWILLAVDQGACGEPCARKLFFMRQTHVSLGKDRGRMARVLLVVDQAPLPAPVLEAHPDLAVFRVRQQDLEGLLPVESASALADHMYVIDPLHNLMMRFPKDPDPTGTRKDLQKLLKASRIG